MPSSLKLHVVAGPTQGTVVGFDGEQLTIGRAPDANLVLPDSLVSRRHCVVERQGDDFVLVDLASNNGTFLVGRDRRIERHTLEHGDQILIGKSRLGVELQRPPRTAAADAGASGETISEAASTVAGLAPPPQRVPPSAVGAVRPSDLPIILTVLDGADRGMVYSPTKDVIRIGRLSTSDVPLNDAMVSRVHATIKREPGGYSVYDENSRNGIELGTPPQPVFHSGLKSGDHLRLGDTEIRVDIGGGTGGEEPSPAATFSGTLGGRTFRMKLATLGPRRPRPAGVTDSDMTMVRLRPEAALEGVRPAPGPAAVPAAPPPPRIVLRIVSGPDAGRAIEPAAGTIRFTVGRAADKADFAIGDPGASSLHFSITVENGEFVLEDEGSRNGTFLDSKPERVTSAKLRDGQEIRAGSSDFRVEIIGAAKPATPAGLSTMVMAPPGAAPPAPPAPPPRAATPPEQKSEAKKKAKELVPELARSAEAKERISRMMKGVSLRPVRRPGTPRQWATVAMIVFSVGASYLLPRTWVTAGPVHQSHADVESACETCHAPARRMSLLSIAGTARAGMAMNGSCAAANCHANDLRNHAALHDDCVSCHTEHRGRAFAIRGGADLCWSCHRSGLGVQDFDTRLMKVGVTRDPSLQARLAARLHPIEIGLRFSHAAHEKETKGDAKYDNCIGCHPSVQQGRTFALPSHAQCIDCHAEVGAADAQAAKQKKGAQCLQCHLREDGEMVKLPPGPFGYVQFSHRDHLKENCTSCHAAVWEEGAYRTFQRDPEIYHVAMDACVTCHEQKRAAVDCLSCHREHHSFPTVAAAAAAGGTGFDRWLLGILVLSLGVAGYVWADARVARRFLEPPPTPPPAPGAPPAPAQAGSQAAEILPFPKVDIEACISCGSCYGSCPKQVLAGDDHGKSTVVNPSSCIALEGCAVCEQGCPTGAIRVSTAPLKRQVERPEIDEHNEAKNIPGVFFAGEVIGAALIKTAIKQGFDDIKYITEKKPRVPEVPYDVIVVGAGPAGLAAGLEAKRQNLRYLIVERDTAASTIKNYPRDKAVLSEPVKMPLYGQLPMMDAEKDALVAVWTTIVTQYALEVKEKEEVTDVKKVGGRVEVTTTKGKYLAANVVLAIGTRGDPRKLGVPGESLERVAYSLIDAAEFRGKSVLVVGGGDSAIEAACALAKTEGTTCVLSYRKNAFSRVKKRNQEQIDELAKAGRIELLFSSTIEEVGPKSVKLKTESGIREIPADQIFALIGADPPKGWIEKKVGVPFVMREEEVVTW